MKCEAIDSILQKPHPSAYMYVDEAIVFVERIRTLKVCHDIAHEATFVSMVLRSH